MVFLLSTNFWVHDELAAAYFLLRLSKVDQPFEKVFLSSFSYFLLTKCRQWWCRILKISEEKILTLVVGLLSMKSELMGSDLVMKGPFSSWVFKGSLELAVSIEIASLSNAKSKAGRVLSLVWDISAMRNYSERYFFLFWSFMLNLVPNRAIHRYHSDWNGQSKQALKSSY